jgi:hypothetical protein
MLTPHPPPTHLQEAARAREADGERARGEEAARAAREGVEGRLREAEGRAVAAEDLSAQVAFYWV